MVVRDEGEAVVCGLRLPPWMKRRNRETEETLALKAWLRRNRIHTVCQSAGCPNLPECFQKPTVTFIILGNVCTRHCRFCRIEKGTPLPPDFQEPTRIAGAVKTFRISHAVVTSVTRDDLQDGGSGHFRRTIHSIRTSTKGVHIEVLVPDFGGSLDGVQEVMGAGIDVFGHNIETVPRLYPAVRPESDFFRSLEVLKSASMLSSDVCVKSGLMLGLGETFEEVSDTLSKLLDSGCRAVSIGQYLMPTKNSHPVREYVSPERFECLRDHALRLGFKRVASGPYVRSSYYAETMMP
ncbi:MAG TPA: lipoyl synthase [bacterium]